MTLHLDILWLVFLYLWDVCRVFPHFLKAGSTGKSSYTKGKSQHSGCTRKPGGGWNISRFCYVKEAASELSCIRTAGPAAPNLKACLDVARAEQHGRRGYWSWKLWHRRGLGRRRVVDTCEGERRSLLRGWSVLICCQVCIIWKTRPSMWPFHCNQSGLIALKKQLWWAQPAPKWLLTSLVEYLFSPAGELVKCLKWNYFLWARMSVEIRLLN